MKTAWDYTELASYYVKRPAYSDRAIDQLCSLAGLKKGLSTACDIGAGTGILTKMLLERGYAVTAVEPNDAMRAIGKNLTGRLGPVFWQEGVAEETKMPDKIFDLVTFGSSFNTVRRPEALRETYRILKDEGWFGCLWNHRDLEDPVQRQVEECIKAHVPEYSYGSRREDQSEVIRESGLFHAPLFIEEQHEVHIAKEDYLAAWRSHATLHRQAGVHFEKIIQAIEGLINGTGVLRVPYKTRLWAARKLSIKAKEEAESRSLSPAREDASKPERGKNRNP